MATKPNKQAVAKPLKKPSRSISKITTLFLYAHAGGRCEFDGCNNYLLEHHSTEATGNFAEQAHIYAFNDGGPRGREKRRPKDINVLSNLMLLCKACHHLVDVVSPDIYTVEVLKKFKREHEDRIFFLTGISKDRDTVPLVLKGLVQGRPMDISDEEMQTAVAPNYLKQRDKVEVDLTKVPDSPDAAFWQMSAATIDRGIDQLSRLDVRPGRTLRLSVFALAPIPSLMYLGSKLSDKIHTDLYQRHRNPESWSWKNGPGTASYVTKRLVFGDDPNAVAVLINLSGRNSLEDLPESVREHCTVYELTLTNDQPTPLFLNCREDLERFKTEYIRATAMIHQAHPGTHVIHMFPAVPAPIAITMGRERLPKVNPVLLVYDRDARAGGFVPTLEIR